MSNMSGKLPFDLANGISWNAVVEIRPNSLPRRKVIVEIGCPKQNSPKFTLELNKNDHLSLCIRDLDGKEFHTKSLKPEVFAFKKDILKVQVFITGTSADGANSEVALQVSFGSDQIIEESVKGNFSGTFECGLQTIGAAFDGSYPSSYKLFELVVVGRGPLQKAELDKLNAYFIEKHDIGAVQ